MRDILLANRHLQIVPSGDAKGGLRSFVDKATGRDFVASTPRPLYRLVLAERFQEPVARKRCSRSSLASMRPVM